MSIYAPLNVLKPVDEDIWIIDGPEIKFYGMPFSTRATVIRLGNGDIWVHSPTKLTGGLRAEVAALGPVRYLIAPNWIHYAYVAQWQAAFPGAEAWAAPGVAARAKAYKMDVAFDHDLGQDAPAQWAGEIGQIIVEGSKVHREAVFFHHGSRTLILTDLIENFEARGIPLWFRPLAWMAGILAPNGGAPRDMRMTFLGGKPALRAAVRQMFDWAPERVILAHGKWFERDGLAQIRRAFRWAGAD
jgi:hypothetical protein